MKLISIFVALAAAAATPSKVSKRFQRYLNLMDYAEERLLKNRDFLMNSLDGGDIQSYGHINYIF